MISAEKNNINIRRGPKTSSATIEGIDPNEVIKITEAIDFPQIRTKFFNVPLYCRPLRGLTPTKNNVTDDPKETNDEPITKENLVDTVPLTPENNKKKQQVKKKPVSQNSPGNNILVGGVKFVNKNKDALSEFDFGEGCDEHSDEIENFQTPSNTPRLKRSSADRSPLDSMLDTKKNKTLQLVKMTPIMK